MGRMIRRFEVQLTDGRGEPRASAFRRVVAEMDEAGVPDNAKPVRGGESLGWGWSFEWEETKHRDPADLG